MRTQRSARRGERGIAMAIALFTLATLVIAVATSFLIGGADLRATRSARGVTQVHFVGESAISQALQVANGPGVVNFQNDIVNQWANIWGNGARNFAGLPGVGYTYTVQPLPVAANPVNLGRFRATANGPEGVRNVVVANVVRSDIPSTAPGAVYLASDSQTNSTFNGNSFRIDGNDVNYTGGAGPGPIVPGISTRNDPNSQEAIASLNNNQQHDVTGLGYINGPPVVPSVKTSPAAPSVAQVNQIVNDLLARPGVVNITDGNVNNSTTLPGWCKGNGSCTPTPQITYFNPGGNSSTTIKGNGSVSGSGIMIVEGDLTIQGTLDFKGLVIVRGRTNVVGETDVTGHARLWGSLWTNDINLVVGGDAFVQYSTQALALANIVNGGQALPSPLKVTSLADCAQVPAGTGGCP